MSVAEWDDTYGIHHWRILWSSYWKLPWVGFEPVTTEPTSNALIDWGMRPCVQLSLRVNFLQPLQFHHLLSVTFHFGRLPWLVATFLQPKFSIGNHRSVAEWGDTYDLHHWRILWSSYKKLDWLGFEPTTTEPLWDTLTNWTFHPWFQLSLRANFVQPLPFHHFLCVTFHFSCLPSSVSTIWSTFSVHNHMSVVEWADIYDAPHWRIPWSTYRKLAWVGFDPATAEPHSDALTDWAFQSRFQLSLWAIFVQPLPFCYFFSVTLHFGCLRS